MKLRLFFLFILILIVTNISGVKYNGRIVDYKGKPLLEAVIINTTTKTADYTDKDGNFSIVAVSGDSLQINYMGGVMSCICDLSVTEIEFHRKNRIYQPFLIREKDIDYIIRLYSAERYRECIAWCMHFIDRITTENTLSTRHPYKESDKISIWFSSSKYYIKDLATVSFIGSMAAYQYSLLSNYPTHLLWGELWSEMCASICDDYLHVEVPKSYWQSDDMKEYIMMGQRGKTAASLGAHFLKNLREEKWVSKQREWFDDKSKRITDVLYKNTHKMEDLYSGEPLLQYQIITLGCDYALMHGKYNDIRDNYFRRKEALVKYIEKCAPYYNAEIFGAISSLTSFLTQIAATSPDEEIRKKYNNNLDRFCMEELIKLQDISYYLNGSSVYSLHPNYSLRDIQNQLKNDECAIMHFEAPVAGGLLYSRYDLGTLYRNYAYVITKNQDTPTLWHRGYINDKRVNDLSKIKENNPNVKKFFYVGTPRMAFVDIAGKDGSIVRLHSLSQLIQNRDGKSVGGDITFIGDINYWNVGSVDSRQDDMKGDNGKLYGRLRGPAQELKQIQSLFGDGVYVLNGDDATNYMVKGAILINNGIVHISTHGTTSFNPDRDFNAEDLILKKNVLENSGLILSGYNDNPHSTLSYLSGLDVLSLRQINSNLVFLDACVSGRGAVSVSGAVGIAEAFHLIGVKNIICYLSPVEDNLATQFSNAFYKELSKGLSCHEAFYAAKKSFNEEINVILWE